MFQTKYGFDVPIEPVEKTIEYFTDQLWKLIPMRENGEDWKKQLDTVILEIAGLNEVFLKAPSFLQILSKLEGIKETEPEFETYRKLIFKSISLLRGLYHDFGI